MHSDLDAPGLVLRRNADGAPRYYWRAGKAAIVAGYKPTIVRLHAPEGGALDLADPVHRDFVAIRCQDLQAQMVEAIGGRDKPAFDGTLRSLIELYERHEDSPFRAVRSSTRRAYTGDLKKLRAACGAAPLAKIGATEIRRWYKAALRPKKEGMPERVRSAHGLMVMLRILMSYGVVEELPHADRVRNILSGMRFKVPKPRRVRPAFAHAIATYDEAVKAGAFSIAFGTALQFEAMMRPTDVAGKWEPLKDGEQAVIVMNGRRWSGPTWGDIDAERVLRYDTEKKGRPIEIDFSLYPLICAAMELIPLERRVGPLIVDERSGLPYAEGSYGKRWRTFADKAGVPKEIWNRDFRAGGVSEASEAGATMPDIAKHAAHSDPSFTARVYSRDLLESARRVAEKRIAYRAKNKP